MSANGDDELERRLRDVLHDRGLGLPVPPDAIGRVHAGAHRRQRRRMVATTTAAFAAVAVIAGAAVSIGARPHGHAPAVTAANSSSFAPVSASPVPLPLIVSESPGAVSSPPVVASSAPVLASTPPVPVFSPVSVTAISVKDYWVLGYTESGSTTSTTVLKTTDAGLNFTTVGGPEGVIGTISRGPPGSDIAVITDIRFGDTNNGWVYGNKLSETADGGVSWSPVTGVPGDVVDLAAANGNVWAVVGTAASATTTWGLYHATYGTGGTSAWSRVNLGVLPEGSQPSIAVIKDVAYLLVSPDTTPSIMYIVTSGGAAYTTLAGPCGEQQDAVLSVAGDSSIWAVCNFGHATEDFVSTSLGKQWQPANYVPLTFSLGGVDAKHAVVSYAPNGIALISVDGSSAAVTLPNPQIATGSFIGFTTTSVGFMISDGQGTGWQLLRTTDGGQTWTAVTF